MKKLLKFVQKKKIFLFSDEMYRLIDLGICEQLQPASDKYENAISLWGMSKTFGMGGARLGWVVTRNTTLIDRMLLIKAYTYQYASTPAEILSILALRAKDQILDRNIKIIKSNLKLFSYFLRKHSTKIQAILPQAGTLCYAKITIPNVTAEQLSKQLLDKYGIVLVPALAVCPLAGKQNNKFNYYVRIGFGHQLFREALQKFDEYLSG